MNIAIDQPWWLLLSLFGLVSGLLSWRWMRGIPALRRACVISLRVLLFVILGLTLSSVYWVKKADSIAVIAVVDVSESVQSFASFGQDELGLPISIDTVARSFLAQASKNQQPEDRFGLIAFDQRAQTIALPTQSEVLDRSLDIQPVEGSDIVSAIRHARSQMPPDANARVVLISDGRTTGSRLEDFTIDVPVDVVPIRYSIRDEVTIESVNVPARATQDSVVDIRIAMRSIGESSGKLYLQYDGEPVDLNGENPESAANVTLKPGRQLFEFQVKLGPKRVHRFDAWYQPFESGIDGDQIQYLGDTSLRNNQASGVTMTSGHGRVLIVADQNNEGDSQSDQLIQAMDNAGWEIDQVLPTSFPSDLLDIELYDLVVLVNTPRDAIDLDADEILHAYTTDLGGGVIFIGGREALGAGGWQGTEIEEILPIKLDVADDLIMPPVAVVMVLDSSGSMRNSVMGSSQSQQSIANDSAAGAIEMLDKKDLVGVVSFSNSAKKVVPIGPNSEPESSRSRITSITSSGGTNIVPALEMAREMLVGIEANSKHVVLLSDGESQSPEALPELAKQLGELGIKVSTIAVGDDADEERMRQIAVSSGGKYYRVRNPSVLPRVFLKAIRVVRTPMIREGVITPYVLESDTPATGFIGELPNLGGLVMTDRIGDDPRISTPIVSSKGEPIFAFHQVELGRVAVFTSDVSTWSKQWIESDVFVRFWTNVFAWTIRNDQGEPGELQLVVNGSQVKVEYNAIDPDGAPIDGLDVGVQLFDPTGQEQSIDLVQVGTGQYEGIVDGLATGVHVMIASPKAGEQSLAPTIAGLQINGVEEFKYLSANPDAMVDLANRTGGRVFDLSDPVSADLFDRTNLVERLSLEPIWTLLLIIAFVLFVLDLAARRVAFDRWITQARDETLAVSRSVHADKLATLKATKEKVSNRKMTEPAMDRSPMRSKSDPGTTAQDTVKDQVDESSNPLLAAKRRARSRMEED
ncbi:MAG: VWA domain-containing protein [Phycisphaerales bacterium]|nr:VWA domain-containing protein [Phycisphaerales bacterium]